jgi:hypothetical protein
LENVDFGCSDRCKIDYNAEIPFATEMALRLISLARHVRLLSRKEYWRATVREIAWEMGEDAGLSHSEGAPLLSDG